MSMSTVFRLCSRAPRTRTWPVFDTRDGVEAGVLFRAVMLGVDVVDFMRGTRHVGEMCSSSLYAREHQCAERNCGMSDFASAGASVLSRESTSSLFICLRETLGIHEGLRYLIKQGPEVASSHSGRRGSVSLLHWQRTVLCE